MMINKRDFFVGESWRCEICTHWRDWRCEQCTYCEEPDPSGKYDYDMIMTMAKASDSARHDGLPQLPLNQQRHAIQLPQYHRNYVNVALLAHNYPHNPTIHCGDRSADGHLEPFISTIVSTAEEAPLSRPSFVTPYQVTARFAWILQALHISLTEVYFLGFSLCIKEGYRNTQSVKRPARPAGKKSQTRP